MARSSTRSSAPTCCPARPPGRSSRRSCPTRPTSPTTPSRARSTRSWMASCWASRSTRTSTTRSRPTRSSSPPSSPHASGARSACRCRHDRIRVPSSRWRGAPVSVERVAGRSASRRVHDAESRQPQRPLPSLPMGERGLFRRRTQRRTCQWPLPAPPTGERARVREQATGASRATSTPAGAEPRAASSLLGAPPAVLAAFGGVLLIWGAGYVVNRVAATNADPLWAGVLRTLLAGVVLAPLLALFRVPPPAGRRDRLILLAAALGGAVAWPVLLSLAARSTTASRTGLISSASPVFVALIAIALLGERFTLKKALGMLVALVGVAWLIGARDGGDLGGGVNSGDLIML